MSDYKKRTRDFIQHKKLTIIPAPDRLLIKITRKQIDDLISKEITLNDGTKKRLFFEPIIHDAGYEAKFRQNVSIAEVIGVGRDLHGVLIGDIVILDYLVSSDDTDVVGWIKGDQVISILANTTYHQKSAPIIHGKAAWLKGDYDNISRILGVVRGDILVPFDPYVFLEYQSDVLKILSMDGEAMRTKDKVYHRTVLATTEEGIYRCGDRVRVKSEDLFERDVNGMKISIAFEQDILCKLESNDPVLS